MVFLRRAAHVLVERGRQDPAIRLLVAVVNASRRADSARLELADALFRAGRFEEGLGLNYAMDSLKGDMELGVLNQRRDFFLLLGMSDEASKFEERRLAAELRTLPPARPVWLPRLTVGWQFSHSSLAQDVDTGGLKTILDGEIYGRGLSAGIVPYSDALMNQSLSQGNTQTLQAGLDWNRMFGSLWLDLHGGVQLGYAGDLADLADGSAPWRSCRYALGSMLSRRIGPVDFSLDLDWNRKQYLDAGRWWSQETQLGLRGSLSLWGGSGWLGVGAAQVTTRSLPDGYLSWQGNMGYRRAVPGLPRLTAGIRSSLEAHWLPSITTDNARISWAEGLDSGKSTLDRSIVHYQDSTGSAVDAFNPFTGLADLTYHPGRHILQGRQVYSQYSPGLGMDLQCSLPWAFRLQGGLDLSWTRSIGNVAWSNTRAASSENGELLVWRDRKTGQDYLFASSTTYSALVPLRVQEQVRTDFTKSVSCGLSWTHPFPGTFSTGVSWSWGDLEPYAIDPSSRYHSWAWNAGWSRSW